MNQDQHSPETQSGTTLSTLQQFAQQTKEAVGEAVQSLRDVSNSHHCAALHAWVRQGADELAQILPAFPESVKSVPEAGQIFEPTSQEVFLNKTGRELEIDMGR